MATIIETIGLTKTYSGTRFRAVDGLNLLVGTGEVFGLLGPNGAGKTTTVGVLITGVVPSVGQAFVGGIDVVQHPTLVKQLIGARRQTTSARGSNSRASPRHRSTPPPGFSASLAAASNQWTRTTSRTRRTRR